MMNTSQPRMDSCRGAERRCARGGRVRRRRRRAVGMCAAQKMVCVGAHRERIGPRLDLDVVLAVGEALEGHLGEREAEVGGDLLGKGGVGAACRRGAGGGGGAELRERARGAQRAGDRQPYREDARGVSLARVLGGPRACERLSPPGMSFSFVSASSSTVVVRAPLDRAADTRPAALAPARCDFPRREKVHCWWREITARRQSAREPHNLFAAEHVMPLEPPGKSDGSKTHGGWATTGIAKIYIALEPRQDEILQAAIHLALLTHRLPAYGEPGRARAGSRTGNCLRSPLRTEGSWDRGSCLGSEHRVTSAALQVECRSFAATNN